MKTEAILRELIACLEEENRQLKQLLSPREEDWRRYRRELRIFPSVARALALLIKHAGKSVSREAFIAAGVATSEHCDKMIDIYLCHLRKALREKHIAASVETVRGEGWRLSPEGAAAIEAHLENNRPGDKRRALIELAQQHAH